MREIASCAKYFFKWSGSLFNAIMVVALITNAALNQVEHETDDRKTLGDLEALVWASTACILLPEFSYASKLLDRLIERCSLGRNGQGNQEALLPDRKSVANTFPAQLGRVTSTAASVGNIILRAFNYAGSAYLLLKPAESGAETSLAIISFFIALTLNSSMLLLEPEHDTTRKLSIFREGIVSYGSNVAAIAYSFFYWHATNSILSEMHDDKLISEATQKDLLLIAIILPFFSFFSQKTFFKKTISKLLSPPFKLDYIANPKFHNASKLIFQLLTPLGALEESAVMTVGFYRSMGDIFNNDHKLPPTGIAILKYGFTTIAAPAVALSISSLFYYKPPEERDFEEEDIGNQNDSANP